MQNTVEATTEAISEWILTSAAIFGSAIGAILFIGAKQGTGDIQKRYACAIATSLIFGGFSLYWIIEHYFLSLIAIDITGPRLLFLCFLIGAYFLMWAFPGAVIYNVLSALESDAEKHSEERIGAVMDAAKKLAESRLNK